MANRLTKEQYIHKASIIHNFKYDYCDIEYENGSSLLNLYCKIHNYYFATRADNHTHNKGGCPKCRYDKASASQIITTEEFINRSKEIYGNKFDYSICKYVTAKTKLKLRCIEHDYEFQQTPDKHYNGNGCIKCCNSGYRSALPGYIYVLGNEYITKIGITNRTPEIRLKEINKNKPGFELLYSQFYKDGAIPLAVETSLLWVLKRQYKNVVETFDGSTECFIDVDRDNLIYTAINSGKNLENTYGIRPDITNRNDSLTDS